MSMEKFTTAVDGVQTSASVAWHDRVPFGKPHSTSADRREKVCSAAGLDLAAIRISCGIPFSRLLSSARDAIVRLLGTDVQSLHEFQVPLTQGWAETGAVKLDIMLKAGIFARDFVQAIASDTRGERSDFDPRLVV
jgi:hypothetical protein